MIITSPLKDDHIVEHSLITETQQYLEEHGYSLNVEETYLVINQKTEKENTGYIVQKIQTHTGPLEEVDATEDTFTLWSCTCPAWRYQQGVPDLDKDYDITDYTPCKHCASVEKTIKAEQDDAQRTIDGP